MTTPFLPPGYAVGGKYTVRAELGRGALAATYSATSTSGEEVAIRIGDPALRSAFELMERAQAVGATIRSLPSDLVAAPIDHGQDGSSGAPYVVTPMAASPSLAQLIKSGPLEPSDLAPFVTNLGLALDRLHGLGVAHLGLKPTNVFVGAAPERSVQLTDPGVPMLLRRTSGIDALAWLAPEQSGDPDVGTAAADVFTSAQLAFYALTGRSLLRTAEQSPIDPRAWREEIESRPSACDRARELGVELPPSADAAFRRALAPLPFERHRSVSELAGELSLLTDTLRVFAVAAPASTNTLDEAAARVIPMHDVAPLTEPTAPEQDTSDPDFPPPSVPRLPHDTPGLISLMTTAAPPQAPDGGWPDSGDDPRASVPRAPLSKLPFDAALLEPSQPSVVLGAALSKRALALYAVVGAVLFVVGVALVILAFKHKGAEKEKETAARTEASAPSAGSSAPASSVAPVASAAPTEEPAPTPTPTPAPEEPPPKPAAPEWPATTLRKGEGELLVTCEPACEGLAIDGKITKREGPIAMRGGTHAIGVAKPGYVGQYRRVDVPAGKRTTLNFDLVPVPASTSKKPCAKLPCK